MRNPNEEQRTLRRWSLLSKVAIIQIFRNYQFVLALLHFLAVSYDSVYMVFHFTNLKEECFSSCHEEEILNNHKESSLRSSVSQLFLCLALVTR